MRVLLIRHGPTTGNLEGRYIGRRDEPLSTAGLLRIERCGCFPAVADVFVSGMRRTKQTAGLLFPNARQIALGGFNEMDFGGFEGKNAYDLKDDASYRAWVDGGCAGPCPGGESRADFSARVLLAFDEAMRLAFAERRRDAVFVLHGGTIMEIMSHYAQPHKDYFYWQLGGGEAIVSTAAAKTWAGAPRLARARRYTEIPL